MSVVSLLTIVTEEENVTIKVYKSHVKIFTPLHSHLPIPQGNTSTRFTTHHSWKLQIWQG